MSSAVLELHPRSSGDVFVSTERVSQLLEYVLVVMETEKNKASQEPLSGSVVRASQLSAG
jgi:hypothetical protein